MKLLKNILRSKMMLLYVEIMLGWIHKFIVPINAFKLGMEEFI